MRHRVRPLSSRRSRNHHESAQLWFRRSAKTSRWLLLFMRTLIPAIFVASVIRITLYHVSYLPRPKAYAIPPRLIFTFRSNLLITTKLSPVDKVILANVRKTIALYHQRDGVPMEVLFLSDENCIEQIKSLDSALSDGLDVNALLRYFQSESTPGAVKGDICRAAALYLMGGYYLDVDILPRIPIWELMGSKVDFFTARNAPWPPAPDKGERHGGFFQAVWAARPYHPITLRYLSLYESHAKMKPNEPLWGVWVLENAYNQVLNETPSVLATSLLVDEGWLEEGKDLDVPRLNGTGCCCHAVVRVGPTVAFYSRAPGTGGSNSCHLPDSREEGKS